MNKKMNLTGFEIAIIGMDGRFPGAKNIAEFWENLKNGKESISFFSEEELLEACVDPDLLKNPFYVKANFLLEGIEYFDSFFFDYTQQEAALMDPQIRIFHECAWKALEDAGYAPDTYNGLIGIYGGASNNFNWEVLTALSGKNDQIGGWSTAQLADKDYLCTRVSYKLNLKGPGYTLDTACSTSLVAVHAACQAILNGECDMAVAGGVSATLLNKSGYLYQEGMIFSPDGHVRAFDAGPHGIVGGNGAAVVVLKRLEDAIIDRDHIYAHIKGSAINNDGLQKAGFTAPSVEGQAQVIRTALLMAEVEPETIGYIETHGTATELGDPVEIEALRLVFKSDKNNQKSCAIGSVKTNIGHLNAAAGIASLVKTVLAIKHRLIPPSLNYKRPNPRIDFANCPFYVNTELSRWENKNYPLRAGVSSFGIGGTNAHVILEQGPELESQPKTREFQLLMLSAKTTAALDRFRQDLADHLAENPRLNLADVAYTLQTGRKQFPYRWTAVCPTDESTQAIHYLSSPHQEIPQTAIEMATEKQPPLVFMFSGQGSQYVNMGRGLYLHEPLFREEVNRCFRILEPLIHCNIKDILYPDPEDEHNSLEAAKEKINDIFYSGPIKLLFEYSLAKLLMKWGMKPDAMIGHSFGEYTAACLAGVFSLEDALKLAVKRGQLMQKTQEGAMISVPLPEKELKPLLNRDLSIAAVNTPSLCIVSGPTNPINRLEKELAVKGLECLHINFPRASHSKTMIPILEEFTAVLERIPLNKPQIPFISGLTGTWFTIEQATSPSYWASHMTGTIQFADGIGKLISELNPVFLQVGSDRGLPLFVNQHPLKKEENYTLNIIRHPRENDPDVFYLLEKLGQLWFSGVSPDWKVFYEQEKRNRVSLPTYSFERIPYPAPVPPARVQWSQSASAMTAAIENNENIEMTAATGKEFSSPAKSRQARPQLNTPYTPPQDEIQQTIVEIFQQFFEIEPVGIDDDFYELGGDSLKAVQLTTLLRNANFNITFHQLLLHPNINDICKYLTSAGPPGPDMNTDSDTNRERDEKILKDRVSEADLVCLLEELNQNNRLSSLLKKNSKIHRYEVSPVQKYFLTIHYKAISAVMIYCSYDFFHPVVSEKITDLIAVLIDKNPLLRSVIVNIDNNFFVEEYNTFSNISFPLLDISGYTSTCQEEIIESVTQHIREPINVLDNVLYRTVLLKLDHSRYKLIFGINHLIFDGLSVSILQKQIHNLSRGIVEAQEKKKSIHQYRHYVEFMAARNYENIPLENYINFHEYARSIEESSKLYTVHDMKAETLELDISSLNTKFKDYYNEIIMLVLARTIGQLLGIDRVPFMFQSHGRIYKDANFSHIIGDFHDDVPYLFYLGDHRDSRDIIDGFLQYRRFIRENNLNFINYAVKGYFTDMDIMKLFPPFGLNSIIGSYDYLKNILAAELEQRARTVEISSPHLFMGMLEDLPADKLWLPIMQNSGVSIKEIFIENYLHLVHYLDKK